MIETYYRAVNYLCAGTGSKRCAVKNEPCWVGLKGLSAYREDRLMLQGECRRANDKNAMMIQGDWNVGYGDGTAAWEHTRTSDNQSCWVWYYLLAGYYQGGRERSWALSWNIITIGSTSPEFILRNNGINVT